MQKMQTYAWKYEKIQIKYRIGDSMLAMNLQMHLDLKRKR